MLNEKREKDSMKKTVIISTLVMVFAIGITSVLASEYTKFSSAFIKKFKDCDYYEETTHSEFEGNTFSNDRDAFRSANLTQTWTMFKSWGTGIATNSVAAAIVLA